MTPLEFSISVKNADAKTGFDEVQKKVESLNRSTEELYEGPAREMKVRTEIQGMIKDIAMGQSPLSAMINVMERLSEVAKWALPVGAMLAVVVGVTEEEKNAYDAALKFGEAYKKAMTGDLKNMPLSQLNETIEACQKAEKMFADRGLLERIMEGRQGANFGRTLAQRTADAVAQKQASEAVAIDQQTELRRKGDAEQQIAAIQAKYQTLIDQSDSVLGGHDKAQAYQRAMDEEIEEVQNKQMTADAEVARQKRELQTQLNKDLLAAQAGDPADKLAALKLQLAAIQNQEQEDDSNLSGEPFALIKDKIVAANIQKEINAEEARLKTEAVEKEKQAVEEIKRGAEETARLRESASKAQFDNLSKEDKIVVLRTEQARLEAELKRMVWSPDARLIMDRALAGVTKDLKDLTKNESPFRGINAEDALRGNMSSSGFGRVTNDSANRAEKQRDEMLTHLKTIASKSDPTQISAF